MLSFLAHSKRRVIPLWPSLLSTRNRPCRSRPRHQERHHRAQLLRTPKPRNLPPSCRSYRTRWPHRTCVHYSRRRGPQSRQDSRPARAGSEERPDPVPHYPYRRCGRMARTARRSPGRSRCRTCRRKGREGNGKCRARRTTGRELGEA